MSNTPKTKPSRQRVLAAVPLALAAIGLAACGGSSHPSSQGAKPAAPTKASSGSTGGGKIKVPSNLCSLLSASEISQVVGQSMPAPQVSASGGGETDCDSNSPGSNIGLVSFSLFVEDMYCFNGESPSAACLANTKDTFESDKQYDQQHYGPVQEISGLGEQAYCSTQTVAGTPSATVHVLEGWFRISAFSDTCAHSQALATMLLPRI